VSDSAISKLNRILSAKDKKTLKKDIRYASEWMRPLLSRVAEEREAK
jgi:hypothetical protein